MPDPGSVPTPVSGPLAIVLLSEKSADGLIDVVSNAPVDRDEGIEWVRWPLLMTRLTDPAGPDSPLVRLSDYRWVFAPSPTAVRALHDQLQRLGLDWPAATRAAMTGPGSAATFRRAFGDGPALFLPERPPYDAEHLLRVVASADPDAGSGRALVANRRDATPAWLPQLSKLFAGVDVLPVFEARSIGPPADASAQLNAWRLAGRRLCWIAGSIDQVERLAGWLAATDPGGWSRTRPLFVPHSRIAQRAEALGFDQVIEFDDRDHLARGLQSTAKSSPSGSVLNPSDDRLPVRQAPTTTTPSNASAGAPNDAPGAEAGIDGDRSGAAPVAAEVSDARIVSDDDRGAGTRKGAESEAAAPASSTVVATAPASSTPPAASEPPVSSGPAPQSPPAGPPPFSPPPSHPPPPATAPASRSWWPLLLLLIIGGLAFGGWWMMQQRFLQLERDGARRVQDAESRVTSMEAQLKSLQDAQGQMSSRSGQLEARSGQLEARIAKSADQQEQLQSLYDELAKSRGDTRLAEIEQSVSAAVQYLNLNGNVEAALMSLQTAQGRVGEDADGDNIGLRRLLAQDIERLKGLPAIDLAGAAGRLDAVLGRLDRLPLLSEAAMPTADPQSRPFGPVGPVAEGQDPAATTAADPGAASPGTGGSGATTAPVESAPGAGPVDAAWAHVKGWFSSLRLAFGETVDSARREFRKVVSIQRVDNPDILLLTAEQRQVVRGNVRLQLLNARVNLLNREEALFRQDLGRGVAALERWFDPASREVQASIASLRELQGVPLTLKAPDLTETLTAIRQARAASESRR